MKRNDVFAVLVLGEIASWLVLSVLKGFLKPELYAKLSTILYFGLPVVFPIACLVFLYISILIAKRIAVISQVAKFVLVGGLNALVDWGVLSFLIFTAKNSGISASKVILEIFSVTIVFYTLFKAISFVFANINSYFWNKLWTFKKQTTKKVGKEFLQFFIISLIGFLVNVGIASFIFKFIKPIAGLNNDQWGIIAAAIASLISLAWNFLGYKFVVFKKKNDQLSTVSQI